jgi:hypothetical protein
VGFEELLPTEVGWQLEVSSVPSYVFPTMLVAGKQIRVMPLQEKRQIKCLPGHVLKELRCLLASMVRIGFPQCYPTPCEDHHRTTGQTHLDSVTFQPTEQQT